jgi:hypothetical protein
VGSFLGVENVVWTLSIRCQEKQVYGFVDAAHVLDGQDWSEKNSMVLVLVFSMQSSSWLLCLE